jgi:hypothetical protein
VKKKKNNNFRLEFRLEAGTGGFKYQLTKSDDSFGR